MTAEQFTTLGRALYGLHFISAFAGDLGKNRLTIRRWAEGKTPIPDKVKPEIEAVARKRIQQASVALTEPMGL